MQNQYDDEREMEVLASFVAEEQANRGVFNNNEEPEIIPPLPSNDDNDNDEDRILDNEDLNYIPPPTRDDGSSVVIMEDNTNRPQEPLLAAEDLLHNLHSLNERAATNPSGVGMGLPRSPFAGSPGPPLSSSQPPISPRAPSKKKKSVRWADHTGEDLTVVFFVDSRTEYDRRPAFFREHEEDTIQDRRVKVLCFLILVVLLMILLVLLSRF